MGTEAPISKIFLRKLIAPTCPSTERGHPNPLKSPHELLKSKVMISFIPMPERAASQEENGRPEEIGTSYGRFRTGILRCRCVKNLNIAFASYFSESSYDRYRRKKLGGAVTG